jgi:hypothetical protein
MAKLIRPGKHIKKVRSGNGAEILKKLEDYLESESREPVKILHNFWKDQQNAITYKELREAVVAGTLTEETFREWSNDYSILVQAQLAYLWSEAVVAGSVSQPLVGGLSGFVFDTQTPAIMTWIQQRGAELVTNSTVEQREAIKALLAQSVREHHSVDELARFIRPCIGLTKPQAKANLRYYDNIVKTLREQHPKMKADSIQKKAREAAAKYAEKQHRQRALTIAQNEMATAYNKGADESIRQAQEQKLIGKVIKRWCTSNDDMVCEQCRALEGIEIDMDESFAIKGKSTGESLTPPMHPRCACAIEYIEVGSSDY